ncbi:MAG: hypothetical protein QXN23_01655 [Candidatus Caldarchaeum sp.]
MDEKWRRHLPVVYVPWWDYDDLLEVVVEDEEIAGFYVVYCWFYWSHDWRIPTLDRPEYEPLAIAYRDGVAIMAFWRPHDRLKYGAPLRDDGRPIVYVSPFGHPPRATRSWAILSMLAEPLITFNIHIFHRKVEWEKFVYGHPPDSADIWKGRSFKEFVRLCLSRPETDKNTVSKGWLGKLLRFLWHITMASRAARRGDLKTFYRRLIKAFLTMPSSYRMTTLGCETVKDILGAKYYLSNNIEMDQRLREKMTWKYSPLTLLTTLPELFAELFEKPHTECFERHLKDLRDISKTA